MLFNSLDFFVFLTIVFVIYWFLLNRNIKLQNIFIVVASYFFYGWWDWRFLLLLILTSTVDYLIGVALGKTENPLRRKLLLFASLTCNLGILFFFKYFNFFIESFAKAYTFLGYEFTAERLNIILPIGISFYTFQALGYILDCYRKRVEPVKDPITFYAYLSFFPQLVAGPIERAGNLIPQFENPRVFNYVDATDGLRQILWGLFKKMVIADNCAVYVDEVFLASNYESGGTLLIASFLFVIQIYCDFSGYSDVALGTAKLFGFKLMKNFDYPLFSRDVSEFWRKWHISLTTLVRDTVFFTLGGRTKTLLIRNIYVVFIIIGFWHGPQWSFLVWGVVNATYFIPLLLWHNQNSNYGIVSAGKNLPSINDLLKISSTFLLISLCFILARSNSVNKSLQIYSEIFSFSLFKIPKMPSYILLCLIIFTFIFEWLMRDKDFGLDLRQTSLSRFSRIAIYYLILMFIFLFSGAKSSFIYFQF